MYRLQEKGTQKMGHYDLNHKSTGWDNPGGRGWLQLAVPAAEPQQQSPSALGGAKAPCRAGLVSRVPHVLGAGGTAQQQDGDAGLGQL